MLTELVLLPPRRSGPANLPLATVPAVLLLDIRWGGRPEVVLSLAGTPIRMTYVQLSGRLRIELTGLLDEASGRCALGKLSAQELRAVVGHCSAITCFLTSAWGSLLLPRCAQLPFVGGISINFSNSPRPRVKFDVKCVLLAGYCNGCPAWAAVLATGQCPGARPATELAVAGCPIRPGPSTSSLAAPTSCLRLRCRALGINVLGAATELVPFLDRQISSLLVQP